MSTKIIISELPPYFFDLDAPTLPAVPDECPVTGRPLWRVWCTYCGVYHWHGPGEGHREAHCHDPRSPYERTGYNLVLANE